MPDLSERIPKVEEDGSEHGGPCPWCGGDDRFRVWPDQGTGGLGRYWCRQCRRKGDVIDFLRDYKGLTFREACTDAGLEHLLDEDEDGSVSSRRVKRKEHRAPKPEPPEYSAQEWKERTRAWKMMSAEEVRLRALYRERRTQARERRDRDAFDKWQGKMDALCESVLEREMAGHREVQRLDANTSHLDG